ncbi:MAG: hypothetical protein ACLR3C_14780 [Eggerthella lenta]
MRVRITTFPSRNTAATGVIEEVLGLATTSTRPRVVIARHKPETVFSGSGRWRREARCSTRTARWRRVPRLEGAFHVHHRSS